MKIICMIFTLLLALPISVMAFDASGTYQPIKNPQKLKGSIKIKKLSNGVYELEGELNGPDDAEAFIFAKGKPVPSQENVIDFVVDRDVSFKMIFNDREAEISAIAIRNRDDHQISSTGRYAQPIFWDALERFKFKKK